MRFIGRAAALLTVLVAAPTAAQEGNDRGAAEPVDSARTLLAAPDGDTIALIRPGAVLQVVSEADEAGQWMQVQLEGWIRTGERGESAGTAAPPDLGLAQLRSEPARYVGRVVRWSVQSIGLQRADSLRSDMADGERYLLARDPGGEPGFVYLVVPPELVSAAEALSPLQRFEAVARIRTGRSPLTGHPILDLLEVNP
ncbi:MAG: hypothetical protein WD031_05290 [Gemmatimonadota bacterium]